MTIQQTLEAQLQQLGARRVRANEFPQAARWGTKFLAYTSLSGSKDTFIFLGALGACRTGASPSSSKEAGFLKEKLLARAAHQQAQAKLKPKSAIGLTWRDVDF